jgi:peptidase M48-like protein
MFLILCTIVCLAAFAMAFMITTCIAEACCRLLPKPIWEKANASSFFLLRSLPFLLPLLLTGGLFLPSFLLFEPRQTTETPEPLLIALAMCAALALIGVCIRLISGIVRNWKLTRSWLRKAIKLDLHGENNDVYQVENPRSAVVVTGAFRPRIFIGSDALRALNADEVSAAIAHEVAHTISFDNLKRLFLYATRPPKWLSGLCAAERSWRTAAEIEADSAALCSGVSALDLGSAIVKIARLNRYIELSFQDSHLVPVCEASVLQTRIRSIQRVVTESRQQALSGRSPLAFWLISFALTSYLLILPQALLFCHRVVEWIVQ